MSRRFDTSAKTRAIRRTIASGAFRLRGRSHRELRQAFLFDPWIWSRTSVPREMTAQFRKRVLWQRRAFRRAQIFEPSASLRNGRAQSAKAEAGKYRLDLVDNPRLLSDQILALTVRFASRPPPRSSGLPPCCNGAFRHAASREKRASEVPYRDDRVFARPVFARHRDAGRMDA